MSFDRYHVPVPKTASVCHDWSSLVEEARAKWSQQDQHEVRKKYGGYVIEDDGAIVVICTDDLCAVLEEKDKLFEVATFHNPGSHAVSLANYTVPIQSTAKICSDWPSLRAALVRWPGARIAKKYGGYVVEGYGFVEIACDKKMCEEADRLDGPFDYLYDEIAEFGQSRLRRKQGDA